MHRFPAEVAHPVANAVLDEAAAAQTGAERAFDLSGCLRFDSSLIAVMLELMRRAQADGARCRFEGAGENLLRLAGLYGVAPLLFGEGEGAGIDDPGSTPGWVAVHDRA